MPSMWCCSQRNETEIAVGDQRQRPKKVLAILAVANPRLALWIALERKRVNQHGPAPGELDIVGAAVLQDHAMRQRQFLNTEGRQGGVFELAKTPFVRIGDKRHPVRLQDFVCLWRSRMMKLCFLVRDQQALPSQFVVESRLHEPAVIFAVTAVDFVCKERLHARRRTRSDPGTNRRFGCLARGGRVRGFR